MSWAADNPERYDEIVRKGILNFIEAHMDTHGFTVPGEWGEGYEALIEVIQDSLPLANIYRELQRVAAYHITHAEQDYWGGLVDQAKERFDG